ncbi:adhesin [Providencia manganoxydans]|uniref:adhesin n=1 Tax=Providencia manganoxydans TaxID=2923283 RepID=UPI0032DAB35D
MSRLIHNFCQWKKKKELSHVTLNPLLSLFRHAIVLSGCFAGLFLFSSAVRADYSPRIQSVSSGYLITLSSNSSIATTPIKGTDGKNYYRVGNPIVINGNSSSVSVSGTVDCIGRTWGNGNNSTISSNNAFHRLFMFVPKAGMNVDGKTAYRINSNLVMTVETQIINWINIAGHTCSSATTGLTANASDFTVQFPITVTFYINERIIDGQLPIAAMDLGGYVRAYTASRTTPPQTSWTLSDSSVPMRLAASQLNVGSSCTTMTSTGLAGTVNLRHGQLNTLNYDSVVTEKVTYNCKFSMSTKVRLRLDYATDGDPQKRLPMTSSQNNKIYSDLSMTDEITGQTGKDFKVDIKDLRTIKITSHIQGSNAVAGDYKGSAWLIATFD